MPSSLDEPERFVTSLLSEIPEELIVPLFPSFSGFPWNNFSELLQKQLSIPDFKVQYQNASWRGPIIGNDLERFCFLEVALPPLKTPIYISFMPEDLKVMMGLLLGKSHKPWALTIPEEQNALVYLALEAGVAFSKLPQFQTLGLRVVGFSKPISEKLYQVQFSVSFYGNEAWVQCLIPSSFQREFAAHYQKMPLDPLSMKMSNEVSLQLGIEIGSSSVDVKSWKKAKIGDVLMLDRCTYDPHARKGTGHLSIKDRPLFIVKCKGSEVKILDIAYFEEMTMDNPEEDPLMDPLDHSDDLESLSHAKKQEHRSSDSEYFEEMSGESEEARAPSQEMQKALQDEVIEKELLMDVKVEIGKIQMPLKDLLQLRPGNTLSLSVRPEDPVRLVHLGKCIAKGDLVKLGEVLGVRITQI